MRRLDAERLHAEAHARRRVTPNPSLEPDLHRHGTWPARRSVSIIRLAGQAPSRRSPLSSNVRPHTSTAAHLAPCVQLDRVQLDRRQAIGRSTVARAHSAHARRRALRAQHSRCRAPGCSPAGHSHRASACKSRPRRVRRLHRRRRLQCRESPALAAARSQACRQLALSNAKRPS